MRKQIRSQLRASRPLRLEIFEERSLLSLTSSLLAPVLLPPALPNPPALPMAGMTAPAVPTVDVLGLKAGTVSGDGSQGVAMALSPSAPAGLATTLTLQLPDPGSLGNALASPQGPGAALGAIVSVSVPRTPLEVIQGVIPGALSLRAGVNFTGNNANGGPLDVGGGGLVLPALAIESPAAVHVSLGARAGSKESVAVNAGLAPADPVAVVVRIDASPGGPQRAPVPGSAIVLLGDAALTLNGGGDPGSGIMDSSQGADRSTGILSPPEDEPQTDVGRGPARSDVPPETTLENPPLRALSPLPSGLDREVLDDRAGESQASPAVSSDRPVAASQVTTDGGASPAQEDASLPGPRSEGRLADLFPFDLASLEMDMQALLQQIEQLGGELSSLLGRMNVAPWLMAIAVAAIAGEVARRRYQQRQRGPLLTAGEGAALLWYPGLTGPWSSEEP